MKFSEAMALLEQGKKIRRASWHTETFLYIESGKMLTTHGNSRVIANHPRCRAFEPDELMADDWELYEEPKKKRIVKMWPAVANIYGTNKFCTLANLFTSIEHAKKDGEVFSMGGVDYEIVRLATEYPAVEIEVDE